MNSDDTISGNEEDDTLWGYAGDDKLDGGEGNDHLSGGKGSDTYVFGRGFGRDTIHNQDSSLNRKDVISFIDGLKQEDFTYRRSDNDLIIKAKNNYDQITVQNYFNKRYQIDLITFADGKQLTFEDVKVLVRKNNNQMQELRGNNASLLHLNDMNTINNTNKMIEAMSTFSGGQHLDNLQTPDLSKPNALLSISGANQPLHS